MAAQTGGLVWTRTRVRLSCSECAFKWSTSVSLCKMKRSRTGGPVKSVKNVNNIEEVFNMMTRGASKQGRWPAGYHARVRKSSKRHSRWRRSGFVRRQFRKPVKKRRYGKRTSGSRRPQLSQSCSKYTKHRKVRQKEHDVDHMTEQKQDQITQEQAMTSQSHPSHTARGACWRGGRSRSEVTGATRSEFSGSKRPSTRPRGGDIREQRPDAALDVLAAGNSTSTGGAQDSNRNRLHQTCWPVDQFEHVCVEECPLTTRHTAKRSGDSCGESHRASGGVHPESRSRENQVTIASVLRLITWLGWWRELEEPEQSSARSRETEQSRVRRKAQCADLRDTGSATRYSRRRTEQLHNTQHGGIHDHAAKNQALETASSTQTCKEGDTEPRAANTWVSTWTGKQLVEPPQALDEPRHHTAKMVCVRRSRGEIDALASQTATPESKHSSRQQTGWRRTDEWRSQKSGPTAGKRA